MENRFDRIDKEVKKQIESGNIVGTNICVIKDGKTLYKKSFGYADKENDIRMQEDTIFRMYSMTKPITALATLMLFEDGVIDLYEPVSKYLEGFKNQKVMVNNQIVDVNREVTIRDLLNMTSGIVYPEDWNEVGIKMGKLYDDIGRRFQSGESISAIEFGNEVGRCPLAFQPGEEWRYGGSADVLGGVLEVVTGRRLGDFFEERIFKPLEMKDTAFFVPKEKRNRLSVMYDYDEKDKVLKPYIDNRFAVDKFRETRAFDLAGEGLLSTINDYANFATMLLNKGEFKGKRIVGRKTVDFMVMNQLDEKQLKSNNWESLRGYGYGNLMRVLLDKTKAATNASVGEYGWDGWTGNYITIDPVEDMIFMYFIQRTDSGITEFTKRLRAIVYSSLE